MNSGATAHAAQLSLRGLNSERIEQTVLGSQNEELFLRSWQSSDRNSVLIAWLRPFFQRNGLQEKRFSFLSASCCNLTFSIPKQIEESAQNKGISPAQYLKDVSNRAELYRKSDAVAGREEFVKTLNEAVRLSYPLFLMKLF